VLDYTASETVPDGATWDLVLDAVGKRRSSPLKIACRRAVASGGRYVSVDDGTPGFTAAELAELAELVESGAIRAVIDRVYPLEQIVEAHRYVETDHKRGNVVVSMADAQERAG
jgi:D-arabinose 1-dehydrogenase-like Zn-dependent alcohol dehydrogenase